MDIYGFNTTDLVLTIITIVIIVGLREFHHLKRLFTNESEEEKTSSRSEE